MSTWVNATRSDQKSSGGVIYPIIVAQLQPRIGFAWTARVLGFILLATSIVPTVLMKSRAPPRPPRGLFDRAALRDVPYMLLNLGFLFGFMGMYIVLYYIQLFALARTTISSILADYLLVIINGSSILGRLVPGYYADRVGAINVLTTVVLASTILTFCLLAIRNTAGVVVFSALYGLAIGAFMGLPTAGIVSLSADKSKIGTRLGMTLTFVGFGVLVSDPIAGAILGRDQNWVGLIVWCGVLLVASSVSMVASRIVKVGPGLTRVI